MTSPISSHFHTITKVALAGFWRSLRSCYCICFLYTAVYIVWQMNKQIAVVVVDDDDRGLSRLRVYIREQEAPFYSRENAGNSERARELQPPRCAVHDARKRWIVFYRPALS